MESSEGIGIGEFDGSDAFYRKITLLILQATIIPDSQRITMQPLIVQGIWIGLFASKGLDYVLPRARAWV